MALTEQVRTNSHLFFKLAHDILRDRTAVEDVCQHAFLKAWECRGTIDNEAALRGWLAAVIVNESLRIARRKKVEHRVLGASTTVVSHNQGIAGDAAEMRECVTVAIAALPEPMRLIVSLRMQCGLSGNEVKQIVGCSAAEVSRQLHRGLEILRKNLSAWRDIESGVSHAV